MRLEILVEGSIDKAVLKILLKKIIGDADGHSCNIYQHRGIGKLPNRVLGEDNKKGNENKQRAIKQTLLGSLPLKIEGYKKEKNNNLIVIVLVDLDEKNCLEFKKQLLETSDLCQSSLKVLFRIAIEELEAWFLGDRIAIKKAYPNVKEKVLDSYKQDEICGTWEKLADAVYEGGVQKLYSRYGKHSIKVLGKKAEWASKICPYMDVENNESPSFCVFRDGIRNMIEKHGKPSLPRPRA